MLIMKLPEISEVVKKKLHDMRTLFDIILFLAATILNFTIAGKDGSWGTISTKVMLARVSLRAFNS